MVLLFLAIAFGFALALAIRVVIACASLMRYAIGVDLGGTHIKAASVSASGAVLGRASDQTRDGRERAAGAWVPAIRDLVSHLVYESEARAALGTESS